MFRFRIILIPFVFLPVFILASGLNRDSLQRQIYISIDLNEKIKLLNLLSETWLVENPDKASEMAKEALQIAESVDDMKGKAGSCYLIGVCSFKQNDNITAVNFLLQSLSIYRDLEQEYGQAKTSLALGKVYARRFEFEKSLELLLGASETLNELGKTIDLADAYNSLGGIYYDQQDYHKANEYFTKSKICWEEANDTARLAIAYNNIGEIYRNTGDWEKAMDFYRKAVHINYATHRFDHLALNYDNIANIFINTGLYDSSEYYLKKALWLCTQKNDEYNASFVYLSLGKLFKECNLDDIAGKYYDTCYSLSLKHHILTNIRDASIGLCEINKAKGDFKNAYEFHRIYKNIGDSVINTKNLEKITQLEMGLLFEHDKKLKAQNLVKTRYIYFLIAFVLFCSLVVVLLLYGRLRIKNKHAAIIQENLYLESKHLSREINHKNRELATNVLYLVKKNELINFISEKLLKAKNKFKPENQSMIQEIILDLGANIDTGIWKTFEQRFLEVHREFYERLNHLYPNLTENDRKLCALLRLNMSTKDIAAITHQNPNTIEVARTRLRKKLNLSNQNINLVTFLNNL